MKQNNIHVLMIPTDDPHLSEYVPDAYKRRAYVTGFTGSAGTAVVTLDKGYVWTDSRYFNEANLQLDSGMFYFFNVTDGFNERHTVGRRR